MLMPTFVCVRRVKATITAEGEQEAFTSTTYRSELQRIGHISYNRSAASQHDIGPCFARPTSPWFTAAQRLPSLCLPLSRCYGCLYYATLTDCACARRPLEENDRPMGWQCCLDVYMPLQVKSPNRLSPQHPAQVPESKNRRPAQRDVAGQALICGHTR